jgi:hypothetical protein
MTTVTQQQLDVGEVSSQSDVHTECWWYMILNYINSIITQHNTKTSHLCLTLNNTVSYFTN